MKIGILTFHCAHNYGAVLQCYALQETLKAMGHDVEVIDYRPDFLLNPYRKFHFRRFIRKNPVRLIKAWGGEMLVLNNRFKRYRAFQHFIDKYLSLSKGKAISDKYDAYVIGSDQVWNAKITGGIPHTNYFADFSFTKGNKKYISYAASMGKNEFKDEEAKEYVRNSLVKFDAISVREVQMLDFLQPLISSKKIDVVLDPTLLVGHTVWETIAVKPPIKSKYVLVYQVRENQDTLRIAQQIAHQMGGIVVELVAWLSPNKKKHKYQCASPEEFVGWIKHADCVVTTSFHGTAFSVIFQRSFYCLRLDDGADDRSESLLSNLGLLGRMIAKEDHPQFSSVDYTSALKVLNKLKVHSQRFLENALR